MNSGRVYALVLRLTADQTFARNLTKQIFITTYEQISFFRFDGYFSSWIIGIAVYTVLEALRNDKTATNKDNKKKSFEKDKGEVIKDKNQDEPSFEEDILLLPEKERTAFILHDIESYTDEETADLLSISKNEMNKILEQAHSLLEAKSNFISSIKTLHEKIASLPKDIEPPADLWKEIFAELNRIKAQKIKEHKEKEINNDETPEENKFNKPRRKGKHWAGEFKEQSFESDVKGNGIFKGKKGLYLKAGIILSVLILLLIVGYFLFIAGSNKWNISAVKGTPLLNSIKLNTVSGLLPGDTLKTDINTEAAIKIKDIGQIEIKPNTILQRLKNNFTLKLYIGSIAVNENKTSKVLTVDVPNAAISEYYPGSFYTINLNDAGTSVIFVKKSWIKIFDGKIETYAAPGSYCKIIFGRGAGIPYLQNSSPEFIDDLTRFSFNAYSQELLNKILSESTKDNAISLWNMIGRVNEQDRLKVVNALEEYFPLPAGTTDAVMVKLYKNALIKWLTEIAKK